LYIVIYLFYFGILVACIRMNTSRLNRQLISLWLSSLQANNIYFLSLFKHGASEPWIILGNIFELEVYC